jgi:hypothetical protein
MTDHRFRNSRIYDRADGPLYRQPGRHQTKRLATVPERANAHARLFFSILRQQGRIYDDVAEASGTTRACMKAWRVRTTPSLTAIEACFGALGWFFSPQPAHIETLPPAVASKVAEVAATAAREMPEVWAAAVELAARQLIASEGSARILAEIDAKRDVLRLKRRRRSPANDNTPRQPARKIATSAT